MPQSERLGSNPGSRRPYLTRSSPAILACPRQPPSHRNCDILVFRRSIHHALRGMMPIPKENDESLGFRHLRALSLLLDVGNLTHVAEILETNQPTVSKALRK